MKKCLLKYRIQISLFLSFIILFSFPEISFCETNKTQQNEKLKKIHVLAVFTKFKGEAPGDTLAPSWAADIFSDKPGSISHYFDEISYGQIKISGGYLPKKYELSEFASFYSDSLNHYPLEIIKLIDKDVDYALYDNDGPDGVSGSDDDDGVVDFMVLIPMSRPFNFIREFATGFNCLGYFDTYISEDLNQRKRNVKVKDGSGIIALGQDYSQLCGLFSHEYIHGFGVPDLYDTVYTGNEDDSAGPGYWDIMGRGILGWADRNGPNAPGAYTRFLLGCIGPDNSNLVDLKGYKKDVRIAGAGLPNGQIYRIRVSDKECFLIEYRCNDGIYYDRNIPKNGLLIWHINENVTSNANEYSKRCDLECADGKYLDAGYPLGQIADPVNGGDNLDYWAHDSEYTSAYGGNNGDSTDVFDGVNYTCFGPDTNPNTDSADTGNPTGIKIFNIRKDGNEMVFDVIAPPFTGWLSGSIPNIGAGYQRYVDEPDSLAAKEKVISPKTANYPNPFNSATVIQYSLKTGGEIYLKIFNIAGQKVHEKYLGSKSQGIHSVSFNAGELPSGVYFYRIDSGKISLPGKFEIIR